MYHLNQRLYDETHLPDGFFTPPIPAPHAMARRSWTRNWNIYHVAMNWRSDNHGRDYGRNTAIVRWVAEVEGKRKLARQRIDQIVRQVHWLLRKYQDVDYARDIMEKPTSEPHD